MVSAAADVEVLFGHQDIVERDWEGSESSLLHLLMPSWFGRFGSCVVSGELSSYHGTLHEWIVKEVQCLKRRLSD